MRYTYDYNRKLKSVKLNGIENYVQYSYVESKDSTGAIIKETVTATYKSNDKFVSERDGKGNLLKLTTNDVVQIENTYDKKGQLDTLKDKVTGKNYKFERDALDNVIAVYEVDTNYAPIVGRYSESVEYDQFGNVKKKTVTGPVSQVYEYTFKSDSSRALESISVGNVMIKPQFDIYGRNKGREFSVL